MRDNRTHAAQRRPVTVEDDIYNVTIRVARVARENNELSKKRGLGLIQCLTRAALYFSLSSILCRRLIIG